MSRSKNEVLSNEEEILLLEKRLRRLKKQKSQTSITINGEYKSRGSGSSQGETRPRLNSNEALSPASPVGEPEMQIEELLPNSDGTGARDPRLNVNAVKPPSVRKDTRISKSPVVLHCPEIEPGEIVSSLDEHQARSERRKSSVDAHIGHSSKSKSRGNLFDVEARSATKPKENSAVNPRSPKSPRGNLDAPEVVNVSRRDSRRVISSPEVEQLSTETRSILKNTGASCARSEHIELLATEERNSRNDAQTTLAVSELENSTNKETKPSRKSKQRHSSETVEETPRKKSRTNSETIPEDDSESILFDRKKALLKALSDDLSLSGEHIHQSLAQTWSLILQKGLENDLKDKLLKEYFAPANCKLLKAPVLNDEISIVVDYQARNRDKIMENKQKQLGLGVTAIGRAITVLINRGDNYEINAMQHLNHGCRLLLDLHHTETKSRRHLFKKDLIRSDAFKNLGIHQLDRDDTLFGNKLAKMIKKQGIPMTPIRPARYRDSGMLSRGRHYNEPLSPRRSN